MLIVSKLQLPVKLNIKKLYFDFLIWSLLRKAYGTLKLILSESIFWK